MACSINIQALPFFLYSSSLDTGNQNICFTSKRLSLHFADRRTIDCFCGTGPDLLPTPFFGIENASPGLPGLALDDAIPLDPEPLKCAVDSVEGPQCPPYHREAVGQDD